jgi:hypothetical protein
VRKVFPDALHPLTGLGVCSASQPSEQSPKCGNLKQRRDYKPVPFSWEPLVPRPSVGPAQADYPPASEVNCHNLKVEVVRGLYFVEKFHGVGELVGVGHVGHGLSFREPYLLPD